MLFNTAAFSTPSSFRPLHSIAGCVIAASMWVSGIANAAEFVSVKGNTVNVRAQANTNSNTLWELGKGYPLQVQQRKGQWLKVRDYEASLGWVYAPLTTKTPHRIVRAASANMRATGSTNAKVVGKLKKHDIVRTLKSSGSWTQVQRTDGRTGWVAKNLTWGW